MSETIAARVARALWGPPPERFGILCEQSVMRDGRYQDCGRDAVSWVDAGGVNRYAYCKLHTTVALRSTWYRAHGPVTDEDRAKADDDRLIEWVARGQRAIDNLAAAGLSVVPA